MKLYLLTAFLGPGQFKNFWIPETLAMTLCPPKCQ